MKKFVPLFILVVAVMLAAACGSPPPDAELAAAKAAVADAQAAGAAENCPDKLKAAEDELAKAEAQYAAKEYDACKLTCAEVIKLAEIAKACKPKVVETPPPPPPPAPAPLEKKKIFFDYNKYNIRTDQVANAKDYAASLKKVAKTVMLEGNCDERGSVEYNMALGMKRAKAVQTYLTMNGVDKKLVLVKSNGKDKPVCTTKDEACWQKNRNVTFDF